MASWDVPFPVSERLPRLLLIRAAQRAPFSWARQPLPPKYGNHPSHRFDHNSHVRASKSTKASPRLLPCKLTFVLIIKIYFPPPPAPSPPRTSHLNLRLPCTTTNHAYPVPIHRGKNNHFYAYPVPRPPCANEPTARLASSHASKHPYSSLQPRNHAS